MKIYLLNAWRQTVVITAADNRKVNAALDAAKSAEIVELLDDGYAASRLYAEQREMISEVEDYISSKYKCIINLW